MKIATKLVFLLVAAGVVTGRSATADAPPTDKAAAPDKPAIKATDLFGDSVVAKGKGVEVKRSQLDDTLISIKATAAARGQNIPPEHMAMLEQQVLENLIRIQLLLTKSNDDDKAKGKEACAKRLDEIRTRAGSEEALNRQLSAVGTSREDFTAKMTQECTAEAALERELKVTVSDADIKKFYDDNPSKFEQPEMVRASHILFGTRDTDTNKELPDDKKAAKHKLAEEVLKRARAGEDFAKLAKDYSEDPGSKDKGGEYIFGRNQMVHEFETTAFGLKTNEISDIITTQFGYHIIKLSEKIPARKAALDDEVTFTSSSVLIKSSLSKAAAEMAGPFKKLSDILRENLRQQELQKQLPAYVAKLKKEVGLEILDEQLKSKETPDSPALPPGHPAAVKPDPK